MVLYMNIAETYLYSEQSNWSLVSIAVKAKSQMCCCVLSKTNEFKNLQTNEFKSSINTWLKQRIQTTVEGTGRQWKHDTCAVSLVVYISLCRLQLPANSSDHSKGRSCLVQSHSQLWCTVESASAAGKGSLDSLRPCTNQCTPCMCHDVNTVEREGGEEYSAAGSLWTADPAEREWADSRGAPLVASGAWGDQGKAGSKPGRP